MKRFNFALFAFVTGVVVFALTGCGESKQISEVKALPFGDANMNVDQALDNRTLCNPKWATSQDDHNRTVVEYDCNYKGIDDSMFVKNGMDVVSAGDVWQWTYGPDASPSLTGVGLVIHHKDGTASTTNFGGLMAVALSKMVTENKVTNFDQAYAWLTNSRIPGQPEATQSAQTIPDTTYGNKLASFFPGQPVRDAAIHAYLQKGMAKSVNMQRVDSLGYLEMEDSQEARAGAYPVDPSDVQIAVKTDPYTIRTTGIGPPAVLQDNKLICLNEACYGRDGYLAGKATQATLAQETGSATVNQFNGVVLNAQSTQQVAVGQPTLGQAVAQAASAPLPTGSGDDDWPAMTPCIQKLDDAFVKAAQAQGTDSSVSVDQMKEWTSTCKALGQ